MLAKQGCKAQPKQLYFTTVKSCIACIIMESLSQRCNSPYILKQWLPAN